MEKVLKQAKQKMKKSIDALHDDFNTIRTGRASTSLFEKIYVDYYGQSTPITQLATVSIPEARLVVIQPWDKSVLNNIEKAIQKSELSLNPNNDGKVIRINIPPLTEERRKEYVKMAKNMAEQTRVAVRNIRRDANDELKKMEKKGDITEDDLKKGMDDIQKMTDDFIKDIDEVLDKKEKEIMEV
jgi:ribosome recycling factor